MRHDVIVNYWPIWFRKHYGGKWPTSYICFDLETTNISKHYDFIVEWGYCVVVDCVLVENKSILFDWSKDSKILNHISADGAALFFDSLEKTYRSGRCRVSPELLKLQGIPPLEGLQLIWDYVSNWIKNNVIFVAHNGIKFDEKVLRSNFRLLQIADFSFGENRLLDTNAIEKASQLVNDNRFHPRINDTLRSYFQRVLSYHIPGVKSNLSKHCYNKYFKNLLLDGKKEFHRAYFDAYCCHLLMEVWRKEIDDEVVLPSPFATNTFIRYRGQRS